MPETELFIRGPGDRDAGLAQIPGFRRSDLEAQLRSIDNNESVAAVGGIDPQRANARHLEFNADAVGEGWHVEQGDAFGFAAAAAGPHRHQARRRFEHEARFGLAHGDPSCFKQDRRHTDAIGTRHWWRVFRLHDDPADVRGWILRRNQQIDMAENPAPGLVQHEVAQAAVPFDPARLRPDGISGRRLDSANDHIANLALGMATDDLDDLPRRNAHSTPLHFPV